MSDILTTPLNDEHLALNARMVEFAGYSMPVQYQGVIVEAKAVREGAGMFDVSHMARLIFTGDRVLEYLEHVTTNDVASLTDGTGQYSMLPNKDGGVVDDIIVYRMNDTEFRMVVNASNHAKDVAHLKAENSFGVAIEDKTDETVMIAVQGPKAVEILAGMTDKSEEVKSAPMFGVVQGKFAGIECFAARSGYTGEDGYEVICAAADGPALWQAFLKAGVVPCGLGSRDTLRVEAGLPLYGHELNDEMSPICAGLGWVISKTKSFIGSDHINKVRAEGPAQKLQGIQMSCKRIPQPGMPVIVDGKEVGTICSGVFSPMLDCGIGFAFLDPTIKLGTNCSLDFRGKAEEGVVSSKRFFKRSS